MRIDSIAATLCGLMLASGCAQQPKTLYYWGGYQDQVHAYLQSTDGGDVAQQVAELEAGMEKAKAANQSLPPGYHAQLGMLYFAEGKVDQAVDHLQLEKTIYPESTIYMDRLLARFNKN